jgi:hypothetical protein
MSGDDHGPATRDHSRVARGVGSNQGQGVRAKGDQLAEIVEDVVVT